MRARTSHHLRLAYGHRLKRLNFEEKARTSPIVPLEAGEARSSSCCFIREAENAAKDKLAKHVGSAPSKDKRPRAIEILFAGIGFERNREGPYTVLSPHRSRYRSVPFYTLEEFNLVHKRRCACYLGMVWHEMEPL